MNLHFQIPLFIVLHTNRTPWFCLFSCAILVLLFGNTNGNFFQIFTFLTSDCTLNEAVDNVDSDFLAGSGAGAACASSALAGSFFSSAGAAGSGLFGCS